MHTLKSLLPMMLKDDWMITLDRSDVAFIQNACIDLSKAFDRMQHEILLTEILALGFNYHPFEGSVT